jgi:hypothetical protein
LDAVIDNVRWLTQVAACAVLAACSGVKLEQPVSATPAAVAAQRTAVENWQVTLRLSGGFAGLQRELELSSTGQVTAIDRKLNKQVKTEVTETELTEIASLVTKAQPYPSGRAERCRDCLEYHLDVRADSRRFSTDLDDTNLTSSGLEALIKALITVQNRALAGQLSR